MDLYDGHNTITKAELPEITTVVQQIQYYGASNNSTSFDMKFNAIVYGISEYPGNASKHIQYEADLQTLI